MKDLIWSYHSCQYSVTILATEDKYSRYTSHPGLSVHHSFNGQSAVSILSYYVLTRKLNEFQELIQDHKTSNRAIGIIWISIQSDNQETILLSSVLDCYYFTHLPHCLPKGEQRLYENWLLAQLEQVHISTLSVHFFLRPQFSTISCEWGYMPTDKSQELHSVVWGDSFYSFFQ